MSTGSPRLIMFAGLVLIFISGGLLLFSNRDRPPAPPPQRPAGIVFEATHPSVPGGRLVLLGSMHLLPASADPLPVVYTSALKSADEILFELDPAEVASPSSRDAIVKHTTYADGSSWREHVAPATARRVQAVAARENISLESLKGKRVHVVAQYLGQHRLAQAGYGKQWGVEGLLARTAAQSGATVGGLESLESQLGVFSSLDEAAEESLLVKTLDELEAREDFGLRAASAWWQGNADRIASLTAASVAENPQLAQRLYTERNERITAVIDGHFKKGKSLVVVVGAAHLCGEMSIVELLVQGGGYSVRRMH